jgi:hypothetical protein
MPTDAEIERRTATEAVIRTNAVNATHHASWVWNEELVSYVPPSNPPDSNRPYMWNESTRQWDAYSG